jgi:hypothetical protein
VFENTKGFSKFAPTIDRGVAQLASALAWGARGRTFESYHPDQNKTQSANL